VKLSVIIPAHDEENCIELTIMKLLFVLRQIEFNFEILAVNDNSTDSTETLLQELVSSYSEIRYINNPYPAGFGYAVQCGLESFTGDAVAIVMADGSDSPIDVIKFFRKLEEGYDCVFGSRFTKGGRTRGYPKHKLILNRVINLLICIIFGVKYNDTTNAFKMYRRRTIDGLQPLLSRHFNLTVELPLKAIIRGYSYAVLPNTWENRRGGDSKFKIKEMGSRYLFIILYCLIEKWLALGDCKNANLS
jgi:dolichol-phosphate mannosyltransferase|tara:strand:+ start:21606 stop:22346 length:741 start_codon:yes stop_codon:yes gene_type:complete